MDHKDLKFSMNFNFVEAAEIKTITARTHDQNIGFNFLCFFKWAVGNIVNMLTFRAVIINSNVMTKLRESVCHADTCSHATTYTLCIQSLEIVNQM